MKYAHYFEIAAAANPDSLALVVFSHYVRTRSNNNQVLAYADALVDVHGYTSNAIRQLRKAAENIRQINN